jgi:hypothetical protein
MKMTDKRFWIWEIALTLAFSTMPLIMYGESIIVIMLIVVSYAVVVAMGLISSSKIPVFATWILIFCAADGAYIIDLIIIDTLRLIEMESYPLIIGQIYLLPICLLANALICTVGGLAFRKINKARKGDKR